MLFNIKSGFLFTFIYDLELGLYCFLDFVLDKIYETGVMHVLILLIANVLHKCAIPVG